MCRKLTDLEIANRYVQKARSSAERNIEFNLSFTAYKNLLRAKRCFYTGVELTDPDNSIQTPTTRTIDRIDSSKGYVHGNVVACCFQINQAKSVFEKKIHGFPEGLLIRGMKKCVQVIDKGSK